MSAALGRVVYGEADLTGYGWLVATGPTLLTDEQLEEELLLPLATANLRGTDVLVRRG